MKDWDLGKVAAWFLLLLFSLLAWAVLIGWLT